MESVATAATVLPSERRGWELLPAGPALVVRKAAHTPSVGDTADDCDTVAALLMADAVPDALTVVGALPPHTNARKAAAREAGAQTGAKLAEVTSLDGAADTVAERMVAGRQGMDAASEVPLDTPGVALPLGAQLLPPCVVRPQHWWRGASRSRRSWLHCPLLLPEIDTL